MKKIFVVGRNRSGTKWMSNLLAEHPDVAVLQREGADGILETNFINNYSNLLSGITNTENYTAFKILCKESNFFKVSGLSEKDVFDKRYRDIYQFFEAFMDKYAKSKACNTWLQKADSLQLPKLLKQFPDAEFIIMQRDSVKDNILSNMVLNEKDISTGNITRYIMSYWYHRKVEKKYYHSDNVQVVKFEKLKEENTEEVVRPVCEELRLGYSDDLLSSSYKKNTSYRKKNKEDYDTKSFRFTVSILSLIISVLPFTILDIAKKLNRIGRCVSSKEFSKFCPLTFSIYRK